MPASCGISSRLRTFYPNISASLNLKLALSTAWSASSTIWSELFFAKTGCKNWFTLDKGMAQNGISQVTLIAEMNLPCQNCCQSSFTHSINLGVVTLQTPWSCSLPWIVTNRTREFSSLCLAKVVSKACVECYDRAISFLIRLFIRQS